MGSKPAITPTAILAINNEIKACNFNLRISERSINMPATTAVNKLYCIIFSVMQVEFQFFNEKDFV
ncbi:hypothetical protein GCM10011506_00370 [Marivirga lumbricoides]|uniref:Uncharacterized protein n=1 Tax=Marivirga lumbricoides TaxID=1046115 RepID=A0ABQ1L6U7_9BACT|nr:hypothetical protein GCM10011506_00370 [Marivirga lumbricoides]